MELIPLCGVDVYRYSPATVPHIQPCGHRRSEPAELLAPCMSMSRPYNWGRAQNGGYILQDRHRGSEALKAGPARAMLCAAQPEVPCDTRHVVCAVTTPRTPAVDVAIAPGATVRKGRPGRLRRRADAGRLP